MRGDLRDQSGLVGRTDQTRPSGPGPGTMAPALEPQAAPAANRGWIDPVQLGNVNHSMAGIHRGQGSLTDVVGGVRALHHPTLADRHVL